MMDQVKKYLIIITTEKIFKFLKIFTKMKKKNMGNLNGAMDANIREIFLKIFSMEKENIIGMNINIMMETGTKEILMEMENLYIMMEAFMKGNLLKEKNLEKVNMFGMKINTMMGIGRMISKMDMVFIIIMVKLLKDIGQMEKFQIKLEIII